MVLRETDISNSLRLQSVYSSNALHCSLKTAEQRPLFITVCIFSYFSLVHFLQQCSRCYKMHISLKSFFKRPLQYWITGFLMPRIESLHYGCFYYLFRKCYITVGFRSCSFLCLQHGLKRTLHSIAICILYSKRLIVPNKVSFVGEFYENKWIGWPRKHTVNKMRLSGSLQKGRVIFRIT